MVRHFRALRRLSFCSLLILAPAFLLWSLLPAVSNAAEVTLAWDPPPEQDIAGYKIYYGPQSGTYDHTIDVGNVTIYTVTGLESGGTYYYVATSYNGEGRESVYSEEISHTIPIPNRPPVAEDSTLTLQEDGAASGTLTATDPDGDALTYAILSGPAKGIVTLTDASTGAYTYVPNPNVHGTDSFAFHAHDGEVASEPATVYVTVTPVNDPPMAVSDSRATDEDTAVIIQVLSNDLDIDGDPLTLLSVSQGSLGTAGIQGAGVLYTPHKDAFGADSFTYEVGDGNGGTAVGYVYVELRPVNDAPVAYDGVLSATESTPAEGTLAASDVEGDALIYAVVQNGSKGTVILEDAGTGAYVYIPMDDVTGVDTFTFTVRDGYAESSPATVTVTIARAEAPFPMETGEVTADHQWTWVPFSEIFEDPVVVAKPVAYNDGDPCVVRIRNVGVNGFEIRLQEWDYLDGFHDPEQVGYLVMERGSHTLPDGTLVEAGRFDTDETRSFRGTNFVRPFGVVPVVVASIATFEGQDAVTGRIRNVGVGGFEYKLQEQESNKKSHLTESVSYIAWEPSSGRVGTIEFEVNRTEDAVTDTWHGIVFSQYFSQTPGILADMQTADGGDTAALRYRNKDVVGVDVKVEEEQSKNRETSHTTEMVGYMAVARTE